MVAEFSKDEQFKKLEVFRPCVKHNSTSPTLAQPNKPQPHHSNAERTRPHIRNEGLRCLLEGKPPPKNMLKRSSGEMSASKPRWKSAWLCPWRVGLSFSSPNWSYCFLFSGLLSTAYAFPMAVTWKMRKQSAPFSHLQP